MDQSKPVSTPLGVHFKLQSGTEDDSQRQSEVMRTIPYQSVVGSLMYSMIGAMPDLAYPVGLVCRFMRKPMKEHWQAVKWILRYIHGSFKRKLCYRKDKEFVVKGYFDLDYAAYLDKRKSTSGMVLTVGGNIISWRSGL